LDERSGKNPLKLLNEIVSLNVGRRQHFPFARNHFSRLSRQKDLAQEASQVRVLVGPEWNVARSFEILGQVLDFVGDLFEELRILAQ
jgi:hypothetical protein